MAPSDMERDMWVTGFKYVLISKQEVQKIIDRRTLATEEESIQASMKPKIKAKRQSSSQPAK